MAEPQNPGNAQPPVLPEKSGGNRTPAIIAIAIAVIVALGIGVWALFLRGGDGDGTEDATPGGEDTTEESTDEETDAEEETTEDEDDDAGAGNDFGGVTVRIGTTDISYPHWDILTELAAEEGIVLEFIGYSEYTQPNPALAEGSIDLNTFQHLLYLANHNIATGDDLQPIGPTLVVPLPLYSDVYETVEEFQDGDQVAIPNDQTNQARALFVLEAAGLITLTGDPAFPQPEDIDEASSVVSVVPVDAAQTAVLLDELAGAVVNNNFATDAGLDLDGYVFADDPADVGAQPYINIFAARPGDVDNEVYQRVAELYHTPEVTESAVATSGGTAVIVSFEDYTGEELRDILAQLEVDIEASNS